MSTQVISSRAYTVVHKKYTLTNIWEQMKTRSSEEELMAYFP
jgi:hypothetical protein